MPYESVASTELSTTLTRLLATLRALVDDTAFWRPAAEAERPLRDLIERLESIEHRVEAPLVVAMLGGSGTGKSTLVNAIVGEPIVATGRQRPTTTTPTLLCRPGISPEVLGIPAEDVRVVPREKAILRDFVLIDCPDPDTSEDGEGVDAETNLDRLRAILPHCDVLLLTATQQKYHSARVMEELATAASGAKLLCVQTHADRDEDIREDWRALLGEEVAPESMFLVDSTSALHAADATPDGEFARLLDALATQLDRRAAVRIRRMNVDRLVADRVAEVERRITPALPKVEALRGAIAKQRASLTAAFAERLSDELPRGAAYWRSRLLSDIAMRWGFCPFQIALRLYMSLGSLISGAVFLRMRSTAQLAVWGAVEGVRAIQSSTRKLSAKKRLDRMAETCWNEHELHESSFVLRGYVQEAGLDTALVDDDRVVKEAARGAGRWTKTVQQAMEDALAKIAERSSGFLTRWSYNIAISAMLLYVMYRPAKNYFYDSFFHGAAIHGLDFYLVSLFWLALGAGGLLWMFTSLVQRRLAREMRLIAQDKAMASRAAAVFEDVDDRVDRIEQYAARLKSLAEVGDNGA